MLLRTVSYIYAASDINCRVKNVFKLVYVLQVAWNPNLGNHHWLAVAGNAGLLRILCVRDVGSHYAATRCASVLSRRHMESGE